MIENAGAAALWAAYGAATLSASEQAIMGQPEVWAFGDSPELADELVGLVIQG